MPTTPNMGLVLPTEGGDSDTWDTLLNAALGVSGTGIDGHDHTPGKGVKIPSAALKINADVSWSFSGTNYAITDVKAIDFVATTAASVASYAGAFFLNSDDSNELYFRSVGGTNIKITSGTTLNVSIVGGIGGDYSTVSALLDYDDATDTYRARQETSASVRQYAKFSIADLIIREYDPAGDASVPVETITIKSPDALAASYALTLPTALPGSTSLVQCSSTGAMSASNTIPTPTAADYKHTDEIPIVLPASLCIDRIGTHTKGTGGTSGAMNHYVMAASSNPLVWPIPVDVGDRITGYTLYLKKNTEAANTILAQLYKTDSALTETGLGAGNSSSANAPGDITLSETGLSIDVVSGEQYYLVFTNFDGGVTPAADRVYHAVVKRTRP